MIDPVLPNDNSRDRHPRKSDKNEVYLIDV